MTATSTSRAIHKARVDAVASHLAGAWDEVVEDQLPPMKPSMMWRVAEYLVHQGVYNDAGGRDGDRGEAEC